MKKCLVATIVVFAALSLVSSAQAATVGQRNALRSAKSYLRVSAFSKPGLINQLKFEHYSASEARWAVARVRVSWKLQAYKKAKAYLRMSSFSRQGLLDQLEFEGFTDSQARYGVKRAYR